MAEGYIEDFDERSTLTIELQHSSTFVDMHKMVVGRPRGGETTCHWISRVLEETPHLGKRSVAAWITLLPGGEIVVGTSTLMAGVLETGR